MQRALISTCIFLALLGCEKQSLPNNPQLVTDRDTVDFEAQFIGTKPQQSLVIENGGLTELSIASATLSGDPAFTLEGPDKNPLKGKEHAFLRIIFTPTQVKTYTGSL